MLIYDFHYNYIKRKYPDSMLLFTNTDSLTYQIQMDNMYENFHANKHLFNFSGYEKENPFYNDKNKKVIGKMKDKLNREIIEEFFSLRAKKYSMKRKNEEMKKAKGVKKNIVKKNISLKKENSCIPCRLYDQLNINSMPSHPLALTMINKTLWMMELTLCHTDILVYCTCLGNLLLIFSETFVIYFNFQEP